MSSAPCQPLDQPAIPGPDAPNRKFWARVELLVDAPQRRKPSGSIIGFAEMRLGVGLVAIFCISTAALMAGWAFAPMIVGWDSTAIVSDSMAPQIRRGDTVVFRPAGEQVLEPGAVIRFFGEGSKQATVHRVVELDAEASSYITQGDANQNADSDAVGHSAVVGVGALLVPLVGWPVVWLAEGNLFSFAIFAIGTAAVLWFARGVVSGVLVKSPGPRVGPLTTATIRSLDGAGEALLLPALANGASLGRLDHG